MAIVVISKLPKERFQTTRVSMDVADDVVHDLFPGPLI